MYFFFAADIWTSNKNSVKKTSSASYRIVWQWKQSESKNQAKQIDGDETIDVDEMEKESSRIVCVNQKCDADSLLNIFSII